MRVSPTDYADATRVATWMVAGLYFLAGLVIGVSARHFALQGGAHLLALLLSALLCNAIILGLPAFLLAAHRAAIAAGDRGPQRPRLSRGRSSAAKWRKFSSRWAASPSPSGFLPKSSWCWSGVSREESK